MKFDLTTQDIAMLKTANRQIAGLADLVKRIEKAEAGPVKGKCPHSGCHHTPFGSERALTSHLIEIHHYVDDPYGEDTAQTNAWDSFHRPR